MTQRSARKEFFWTAVAFVLAAVPTWMLLLGGMSAMHSMGTFADVCSKPPDKSMMMPMMQAIHHFMKGYLGCAFLPSVIVLLVIWSYASRNYPRLANRIGRDWPPDSLLLGSTWSVSSA